MRTARLLCAAPFDFPVKAAGEEQTHVIGMRIVVVTFVQLSMRFASAATGCRIWCAVFLAAGCDFFFAINAS
jgi:hypothetical protein